MYVSLNNLMTWKDFIYTYTLRKFPKYKNSTSNISISIATEVSVESNSAGLDCAVQQPPAKCDYRAPETQLSLN